MLLRKDNQLVVQTNPLRNNLSNNLSRVNRARVNKGRKVNRHGCKLHHNLNHSPANNHITRRNSSRHKQEHPQPATRPQHRHPAPPRNRGRNRDRNLNNSKQDRSHSLKASSSSSSKASLNNSRGRSKCSNTRG